MTRATVVDRRAVQLEQACAAEREKALEQPPPAPEPSLWIWCSCRRPVHDRMYLHHWLCRFCGRLMRGDS
jgi:hypothetical protein